MNKQDLDYYGIYADGLVNCQKTILDEIGKILNQLSEDPEYALAEHIRSRIKSSGSIREKLKLRGYPEDARTGLTVLSDIVGARIVTHFVGDVYAVLNSVRESGCWEVVAVKDYISNPKSNGYRSLHVILRIPAALPDFEFILAELQLRTIAMDCWASLEHQMKYKKSVRNGELIAEELKRCADEMASVDLSMQTIRNMILSD